MTKREKQLIDDCILLLISQEEINAAMLEGKNTSALVWQALKPYKLKAIAKIGRRIKRLKKELNG